MIAQTCRFLSSARWCPLSIARSTPGLRRGDTVRFAHAGGYHVHAFEPTPSKAKTIRQRLKETGLLRRNVTFHEVALSNYSGTASFYASDFLDGVADQLGPPKWEQSAQAARSVSGGRLVSVQVQTLDEVLGPETTVLYAKVDAQSHDPEVLYGAAQLLASHRLTYFAFEVWPARQAANVVTYAQLTGWLASFGYRCHDCARPSWKLAPHVHHTWPAIELVRNLSLDTSVFSGVQTGAWTNFVCMRHQ